MTERACLPEPPCDCRTVTVWPVFAFQCLAKPAFSSWYSGDHFEKASLFWRLTGTYWWALGTMYFCNCVAPLILFWKPARTNNVILYVVSILVLIGMWFERFNIIVPSLAHDFYPATWGIYVPTITDSTIIIGSFAWFSGLPI